MLPLPSNLLLLPPVANVPMVSFHCVDQSALARSYYAPFLYGCLSQIGRPQGHEGGGKLTPLGLLVHIETLQAFLLGISEADNLLTMPIEQVFSR